MPRENRIVERRLWGKAVVEDPVFERLICAHFGRCDFSHVELAEQNRAIYLRASNCDPEKVGQLT